MAVILPAGRKQIKFIAHNISPIKSGKAPVVVFTYRKANFLNEIFDCIRQYAPPKLYITQNCAANAAEQQTIDAVKEVITAAKFPFPVEYILHQQHLQVKDVFPVSLNKIFEQEEELIVLEDDTIPSPSFFTFCNAMLQKHKSDKQIGCISGCNLEAVAEQNAYFLSGLCVPFWGWATWKESWSLYKEGPAYWETNQNDITDGIAVHKDFFANSFNNFKRLQHTWDIPWNLSLMANRKKCIIPGINLITNKGFVPEGTFTDYEHSQFNNLKRHNFTTSEYELKTDAYFQNSYENLILALFKEVSPSRKKNKA